MKVKTIAWMAAAAIALTACGGGGGGDASPPPTQTVAIDVNGTAAKGLIANGIVSVHEVGAGGLSATALGTGTTDLAGRFNVRVNLPQGRPFVVTVAGGAGASHLDEVSGQSQALPESFALRAAVVPSGTTTFSVNVTPFSEMAVAAAEKASGGLGEASIRSSNAVVAQLLGFDPRAVAIRTTTTAGSVDEQRLALLLAAVSQMAASGAAGCNSGTPGERAACVVDKLADATSTTSLRLSAGGLDLSAALLEAINTVLQQPRLAGNVSGAVLAAIRQNLDCSGAACAPSTATPPTTVAEAIAATKAMLADLKSDWNVLFVSGGTSGVGDAKAEATRFGDAMRAIQAPVELLVKDTGAMALGIDLFNDYKAGRTTINGRSRGFGLFASEGYQPAEPGGVGCTVYQDGNFTTPATSAVNAATVACSARYFYDYNTGTEYSHAIGLVPAGNGQFNYSSRARSRTGGVSTMLPTGSTPLRTGSVTTTLNGAGQVVAMAISGDLPGAFDFGGKTLVSDHHTVTLSGTRTNDASGSTTSLAGNIVVKNASNATLGTLALRSASLREVATGSGGQLAGATLDIGWTTAAAAFQGMLSATDPEWSNDRAQYLPTRLVLEGTLSNISGSTETDFVSGKVTLAAIGFGAYLPSQATSPTNFVTHDLAFTGSVTAPGRPMLQLTVGTTQKSSDDRPGVATLQYRSVAGGAARMTIAVAVTLDGAGVPTYALSEPVQGLSLALRQGAGSADLVWNGSTVIGVVHTSSGLLTFSDGTFISIELAR